jgi:hypothetical protein
MKLRNVIKILMIFSFVLSAQAQTCDKKDQNEIAKEVVIAELLGASLSSPFKCLKEHPFKFIKPQWFAPNDGNRVFSVGIVLDSLRITSINVIDEFSGQYSVTFEVKAEEKFGGKIHQDKMEVALFPNPEGQERYGCGHSMSSPAQDYLAQRCYAKAQSQDQESKP